MTPEEAWSTRCCGPPETGRTVLMADKECADPREYGKRYCLGPSCMAWRWGQSNLTGGTYKNSGYCGLAGKDGAP